MMKAMIENNRSSRVLTTGLILTMATAIGYGQGLLAEGAAKLFNALTNNNTNEQSMIHRITYAGQASRNAEREFSPKVVRSFNVEAVNITFEQEVKSEDWMTESFAGNVEAGVEVETWMTTPISESIETPVSVETWMTTPMNQDLEEAVTVEEWMTVPMNENLEAAPVTEEWMTTPLYTSVETAPEVENWMTTPLVGNEASEEPVQLEAWMTESFR
ncbi:MAG: hypothetical protein P1P82_14660 [Bacteroidales bacterium]|nr:hypothetical protein [Bacteroidales bacterium]MDT8432327.1 hypothetical protein [Bacteroidales bacterium]